MTARFGVLLSVCAALAAPALMGARAAGPPLPVPLPVVPDTALDRVQTQLAIQQAQAQASLAASQARLQAQMNATQARLQGQVTAQEQAQMGAARQPIAAPVLGTDLALNSAAMPYRQPGVPGTLRLATLTPRLGRYFGTDHGILVVRAPRHGVLKLQDGDVILTIGGRTPVSSSQAVRILTSYDPGQKIDLVILREHRKLHLTGTLPAAP
jgi:S1-C subfamily serine protease